MVKFRTDKRDGHKYAVEEHGGFASEILGGRNSESNDREQELLEYAEEKDKWLDSEGNKIPEAPYYVVMRDTFMSGWGKAENKHNILVFDADNLEEARIIRDNAKNREDMNFIRIQKHLSGLANDIENNYVQYKGKHNEDAYLKWYEEGAFKKKTKEEYNGWTNYDTWAVGLWFDNDQETQNEVKSIVNDNELSEDEIEEKLKRIAKKVVKDE